MRVARVALPTVLPALVAAPHLLGCSDRAEAAPTPPTVATVSPAAAPPAAPPPASSAAPGPDAASGSCPESMIAIPAGGFSMGANDGMPRDRPVHEARVDAFCMDRFEVTVAQFEACVAAGARKADSASQVYWPGLGGRDAAVFNQACNLGKSDRKDHPINCVDASQAEAYCAFAKKRLPSETEWEYAARGGEEGRRYPWDNDSPSVTRANLCGSECTRYFWEKGPVEATSYYNALARETVGRDDIDNHDAFATTAPVGSFPEGASRWGVHDLIGNVWEWTSSGFSERYDGPRTQTSRVVRGAGWTIGRPAWVRNAHRYEDEESNRSHDLGFRCVASRTPAAADMEGPAPPPAPEDPVPNPDPEWTAQTLGDLCYVLYRRNKLDVAEKACKYALAKPEKTAWVHGALYFNLGLIAEKRGNRAEARGHYEKSLEVRPSGAGVAETRNALQRVR